MLTRYVFFEGQTLTGATEFRRRVEHELLPLWRAMPGNTAVRLGFAGTRDADAPGIEMVLAVDYPDLATLNASLASPHRDVTRDRSAALLAGLFRGRVHHHVMQAVDHTSASAPAPDHDLTDKGI